MGTIQVWSASCHGATINIILKNYPKTKKAEKREAERLVFEGKKTQQGILRHRKQDHVRDVLTADAVLFSVLKGHILCPESSTDYRLSA